MDKTKKQGNNISQTGHKVLHYALILSVILAIVGITISYAQPSNGSFNSLAPLPRPNLTTLNSTNSTNSTSNITHPEPIFPRPELNGTNSTNSTSPQANFTSNSTASNQTTNTNSSADQANQSTDPLQNIWNYGVSFISNLLNKI